MELGLAARGPAWPAYPNPEETDMEQDIGAGGVRHVSTTTHATPGVRILRAYIQHELTPEREAELVGLLEHMVVRLVTTWARA